MRSSLRATVKHVCFCTAGMYFTVAMRAAGWHYIGPNQCPKCNTVSKAGCWVCGAQAGKGG